MVAVSMPCKLLLPLEQLAARTLLLHNEQDTTRSNAVKQHTPRQSPLTQLLTPASRLCANLCFTFHGMVEGEESQSNSKLVSLVVCCSRHSARLHKITAQHGAQVVSYPFVLLSASHAHI